jgi:hypothetical protein
MDTELIAASATASDEKTESSAKKEPDHDHEQEQVEEDGVESEIELGEDRKTEISVVEQPARTFHRSEAVLKVHQPKREKTFNIAIEFELKTYENKLVIRHTASIPVDPHKPFIVDGKLQEPYKTTVNTWIDDMVEHSKHPRWLLFKEHGGKWTRTTTQPWINVASTLEDGYRGPLRRAISHFRPSPNDYIVMSWDVKAPPPPLSAWLRCFFCYHCKWPYAYVPVEH